jgi:hypothetical protein
MTRLFVQVSFIAIFGSLVGCGYTLRGNTRPFFEKYQIRTLYVEPVKNNSYKAGIEITVYNALRKRLVQGGYLRLVDSPKGADASMAAEVTDASYTPQGISSSDQIAPIGEGPKNIPISTSYNVNLRIRFKLIDEQKPSRPALWADELSRSKSFPASTYFGALGSTSALINESEFEKVLVDLSNNLVYDAEESINTIF